MHPKFYLVLIFSLILNIIAIFFFFCEILLTHEIYFYINFLIVLLGNKRALVPLCSFQLSNFNYSNNEVSNNLIWRLGLRYVNRT